MKTCSFLFFLVIFAAQLSVAQTTAPNKTTADLRKPIAADCAYAIPVKVETGNYYGPTLPLTGYGTMQELKKTTNKLFDEEHNTAWFLLTMARSGELTFEVRPKDSTNDYDFALFSYNDSSFCDDINKRKSKPIRSNLSNITHSQKGITGLRSGQHDSLIGKGPGNSFSNSITVKKGEQYMLVLDNVTEAGEECIIFFNFVKTVEIKGKIVGSDNLPLAADITLSDNRGNTVLETKSDAKGEYKINTAINENQDYSLIYTADNTFVQTSTVNTKTLKGAAVFPDIRTMLPQLKKGEKYKLGNINFEGDSYMLTPSSIPSVTALYKLMKKNPAMSINIEGHVNDPATTSTNAEAIRNQHLSEARALAVYNILAAKGIAKERIKTEGFSNKHMLFPHPDTDEQRAANRRVEIKVISLE